MSLADTRSQLAIGDSIGPFAVQCVSDRRRVVGARGLTQLVTFSTPGDCATGLPHLAGLDSVALRKQGPGDSFIVAYTPGQKLSEVARIYASRPARDVCVDSVGYAWDALDIQKTPITVLLVSGRVAYLTDKAFLSASSRTKLLGDLERVSQQTVGSVPKLTR